MHPYRSVNMSSHCYCGCATRSNRVQWAAFVIAGLAGLMFLAAYLGVLSRCREPKVDLASTLLFT